MRAPFPVDLAYAAGFFDGEGSVSITHNGRQPHLGLVVDVAQKNQAPLEWLRERWGGVISHRPTGVNHWMLQSLGAVAFLQAVRPFLQVKCAQADLAVEFQQRLVYRGGPGRRLPAEEWVHREGLRQRLILLNKCNGANDNTP